MTQILEPNPKGLQLAAHALIRGQVVAMPTETVYGLAADASNPEAVAQIFKLKQRPQDNPLIVHILPNQANNWATDISPMAQSLMDAFWPGPLTLVLQSNEKLPSITTAGLDSVALRAPSHPIMQQLIQDSGKALAAPSANLSGKPSPTQAQHVLTDMSDQLEFIIDGGACEHGIESTVIDVRGEQAILLRPGSLSIEAINVHLTANNFPELKTGEAPKEVRSPGTKYRHYSPEAKLHIFNSIEELEGKDPADSVVLLSAATKELEAFQQIELGPTGKDWSKNLYAAFRQADEEGLKQIYITEPPHDEHYNALMNRIQKAASSAMLN